MARKSLEGKRFILVSYVVLRLLVLCFLNVLRSSSSSSSFTLPFRNPLYFFLAHGLLLVFSCFCTIRFLLMCRGCLSWSGFNSCLFSILLLPSVSIGALSFVMAGFLQVDLMVIVVRANCEELFLMGRYLSGRLLQI